MAPAAALGEATADGPALSAFALVARLVAAVPATERPVRRKCASVKQTTTSLAGKARSHLAREIETGLR